MRLVQSFSGIAADLPAALITGGSKVIVGGEPSGVNVNVALARLSPVTAKLGIVLPGNEKIGSIDWIIGGGITIKSPVVVKEFPATAIEIGPVVAPAGTVTSKTFAVADITVAAVPLNSTMLSVAIVLKFCP